MSLLDDAYNFFLGKGYNSNAAAGISTGLFAESHLNASAVNPSSGAYGIEQALGSRKSSLFSQYGSSPSFQDQLNFVASELPGNGGSTISAATSPQSALNSFIGLFERPCIGGGTDCGDAQGDISRGTKALSQLNTSGNLFPNNLVQSADDWAQSVWNGVVATTAPLTGQGGNTFIPDTVNAVGTTISNATGGVLKPLVDWLNGVETSIKTWETKTFPSAVERTVFGVVGLLLIAGAIFYLVGTNKTVQSVARSAAAVAA